MGHSSHSPHDKLANGRDEGHYAEGFEGGKQGKEMDKLLLPQRLMENIHALLSKTHCKKDVAKLLNKVTQLWGDFLIYAQILSPGVAGQTLPSGVNQISHLICKCPDCTFLGFNSLSLSPPGNDTS